MAVLVQSKYALGSKNALTFDVGQLGSFFVCHPYARAAKKCSNGSETKPGSVVCREVRSEVSMVGPSSDIKLRCPNTDWVRRAAMRISWIQVSKESKRSYNNV